MQHDMPRIQIMIVDDHQLLRESWCQMLNDHQDFLVIAETGDGPQAILLAEKLKPAVVLMDISMQPMSGIEVTEKINWLQPEVRVIGLSMHSHPGYARRMLQAGASGYVSKNSSTEELIEAITLVARGREYLCTEVREFISSEWLAGQKETPGLDLLTEREMLIAQRVQKGDSSREIAAELGLSLRTIEAHRYHILKKLKLRNTAALVDLMDRPARIL
jgi:DNA-binding NarL/FixJ family response regulator